MTKEKYLPKLIIVAPQRSEYIKYFKEVLEEKVVTGIKVGTATSSFPADKKYHPVCSAKFFDQLGRFVSRNKGIYVPLHHKKTLTDLKKLQFQALEEVYSMADKVDLFLRKTLGRATKEYSEHSKNMDEIIFGEVFGKYGINQIRNNDLLELTKEKKPEIIIIPPIYYPSLIREYPDIEIQFVMGLLDKN